MEKDTMTPYDTDDRRPRLPLAVRAPLQARAWREFLYLVLNLPVGIVFFVYAVVMLSLGVGLLITFLGVPVLAAALAGCRALGALERTRARALLDLDVADPEPLRSREGRTGLLAWVGALFRSGSSWRHLLYGFLHFPWAVFSFAVSVTVMFNAWALFTYPLWQWIFPAHFGQDGLQVYGDEHGNGWYLDTPLEQLLAVALGAVLVMASPWIIRGLACVDRVMVSGLLGPSKLASRVWELESDRGVVVDTAAADLRRIERDLHDGAQARLVSLAMDLGLAKEKLREDPEAAARMVGEAHGEVKLALQELRDLARGIHPAILTDRGLGPALSSVASRCTVPVAVTVDLPVRPAPAIEGIAYFTVSELLQNISKHAGARTANVDVWRADDRLLIQVRDDGHGGATLTASDSAFGAGGSGLAGLAERLGSVDGLFVLDSPEGGPTTITAELPWRNR
ncbi:sensor domain-containing protein [Streptomyces sp. NPDC051940]|uniref:sensor histidine kinase n=1 Tax=Streptomyces sp. NPDC051940 TaxID=3155675 RepID=UPI00343AB231